MGTFVTLPPNLQAKRFCSSPCFSAKVLSCCSKRAICCLRLYNSCSLPFTSPKSALTFLVQLFSSESRCSDALYQCPLRLFYGARALFVMIYRRCTIVAVQPVGADPVYNAVYIYAHTYVRTGRAGYPKSSADAAAPAVSCVLFNPACKRASTYGKSLDLKTSEPCEHSY